VVPEVDSWDEEVHAWRAGDSFPAICKRYYNDEVYATALLEFNRARPQGPEGLQESPPVVRPGQNVFIPPIRILEKEHAAAIPSSPTTVPKPVASSTAVPGERSYRVGKTGEMFLDIAKRTGARWEDIYLLNQKYDPKLPVPPGTVLRLPAGAEQRP
jgi:nucleoid-associated protein YgaU